MNVLSRESEHGHLWIPHSDNGCDIYECVGHL